MYYQKSITQVVGDLQTHKERGLRQTEVKKRQEKQGKNVLPVSKEKTTRFHVFLDQWKSPLIIILVVAGILSGVFKEYTDMSIIFFTAIFNAVIGFFQEYKANKALEKLESLVEYSALVIRDGKKQEVLSQDLVAGDLILLSAGDRVPADARLIRAIDLAVDEAPLTGESDSVKKHTHVIKKKLPVGDRKNMIFRGTILTNGEATAIVCTIGAGTEIGQIATMVKDTKEEKTPLQKQLAKLATFITYVVVIMAVSIFIVGMVFGAGRYTMLELIETAIAVAVAAIPEGLVISLTVILAIGMQYILKQKALVRKLVAAETLGSVSVICTDKTGTLTEGKMRVSHIITASEQTHASQFKAIQKKTSTFTESALALRIGVLCNNSVLQNPDDIKKEWKFIGDSTESALVHAGMLSGVQKHHLDAVLPRNAEIPFSSDYMYMATMHNVEEKQMVYIKGAPEVIIEKAGSYQDGGTVKNITKKQKEWFTGQAKTYASQGYRTLAVGYISYTAKKSSITKKDIKDIVLVGLFALSDPLRSEVKKTIALTKKAGIRVIMITGDHVKTAQAIAYKLGLPSDDMHVCDGAALEHMSDKEVRKIVTQVSVFARVDPKHKIRIVQALQKNNEVVAMTGDGVNDAPAIKAADIGVAVGSGTVVAKETADMVLLDDSFSTIVSAVQEGRGIYQNIKKVVVYLLAGSFAEVIMITGSIVAGLPVAALPGQILWVNLVEDAFPVMALAFDKGDKENMHDKPRKKGEPIIDSTMRTMIIVKSICANIILFALFVYFYTTTNDIALTRTIVFVGFAVDALFFIFAIRSMRHMLWRAPIFDNPYLILSVLFGWAMLLLAVYWHPLQKLLRTVPLAPEHWVVMICFGLFNLLLIELIKGIFLVKRQKPISHV
ncbi:MAG: HAD-IC family P-type ATPase [Candidatus Magasanikbacteria bacterium]|nr:HAD-IC family P-type ATPase [Candidatus Magasanikbacteria bacterium]